MQQCAVSSIVTVSKIMQWGSEEAVDNNKQWRSSVTQSATASSHTSIDSLICGCSQFPYCSKRRTECEAPKLMKDNDLNYKVFMHQTQLANVQTQLRIDAKFLKQQRVMDYSLLLGHPNHLLQYSVRWHTYIIGMDFDLWSALGLQESFPESLPHIDPINPTSHQIEFTDFFFFIQNHCIPAPLQTSSALSQHWSGMAAGVTYSDLVAMNSLQECSLVGVVCWCSWIICNWVVSMATGCFSRRGLRYTRGVSTRSSRRCKDRRDCCPQPSVLRVRNHRCFTGLWLLSPQAQSSYII